MDIVCKHCNATFSISAHKLPKGKATATCKSCGHKIVIDPALSGSGSTPSKISPQSESSQSMVSSKNNSILNDFKVLSGYDSARYNLTEILKPNKKGAYKTRINKLKVKILTTIKPNLDQILRNDEQVMRIAGGTAVYPLEIVFGNGLLTMLYNRYAMVATNQRLVMINTNHSMTRIRHYLFQMTYDDIKKVKRGLFRTSIMLTPKKGKRRGFSSMKPAFAAEMLDFIKARLDPQKTIPAGEGIKPNLCPACFSALGNKLVECSTCHASFKTPVSAALRSLFVPGLGDLYLGHRFLGWCEMIGSFLVWIVALSFLLTGSGEMLFVAAFMLMFYNGIDALLTLHMGKKGYILAKK